MLQGEDAAARGEVQATAAWALGQTLHQLHPIMPFITEEIWENLAGTEAGALITADWPSYDPSLTDAAATAELDWVIAAITAIRGTRTDVNVPAGAFVDLSLRDAGAEVAGRLERQGGLIRRLARVERLETLDGDPPAGSVQVLIPDAVGFMPLAGLVDLDAKRARLEKKLADVGQEVIKLEKKLGNQQFLAKAPEEVVSEQRERLAAMVADRAKLEAALAGLSAA